MATLLVLYVISIPICYVVNRALLRASWDKPYKWTKGDRAVALILCLPSVIGSAILAWVCIQEWLNTQWLDEEAQW